MRQVTIALAQMTPVMDDVSRNLDTMVKLVEDVSLQHKIDLFVFPELATTGYECGVRFADLAERVTDQHGEHPGQVRAEHDTHIVFGMAEKQKVESVIYSAAVMVDPDGEVVADYQKVHLKGAASIVPAGLPLRDGRDAAGHDRRVGGWGPGVSRGGPRSGPGGCRGGVSSAGAGRRPTSTSGAAWPLRGPTRMPCSGGLQPGGEEPTYSFFGESMVVGPRGAVHARLEGDEPGVALATVDLDEVRRAQEETQLLQSRQPRSYRAVVKMY
jgi:predicted amidohydrolase